MRSDFQWQGIGEMLLDEIAGYARENGYDEVRLEVIDTNPRARQLYARKGYQAVHTDRFPYMRWLLGFGASTTMALKVT